MSTQQPGSKELYMMNGGKKHYIYKDGFGDVYNATPAEEYEWQQELIARELTKLDTEQNTVCLKFAIENLQYHQYNNLAPLLLQKLPNASPQQQIVFAGSLWKMVKYAHSFFILYEKLLQQRNNCLDDVFTALQEFKDNREAKKFLINCLQGGDGVLHTKAQITLTMWAYTGMAALRNDNILENIRPENKNMGTFNKAIEQVKKILFSKKDNT